jgi:hypothetical protein
MGIAPCPNNIPISTLQQHASISSTSSSWDFIFDSMPTSSYQLSPGEIKNFATFDQIDHPLFDKTVATQFTLDLGIAFSPFNGDFRPEFLKSRIDEMVNVLNEIDLTKLEGKEKKAQRIASELIALALFPPILENGQTLAVLSFNKTLTSLRMLQDGKLVDQISGRYFFDGLESEDGIPNGRIPPTAVQKLYLISRLNLKNTDETNGFFDLIYNSADLDCFLKNSRVHVPQVYRQTCVATAHNLFFQRRLGTPVEMLQATKECLKPLDSYIKTESKDTNVENDAKKTRANGILEVVLKEIAELQKQLPQDEYSQNDPLAIASMTRDWNFMMQSLATVLNPENPKAYTRLYNPDYFAASSALGALTTAISQILGQGPSNKEIWIGLTPVEMQTIGDRFLSLGQRKYLCRKTNQGIELCEKTFNELENEEIWETVYNHNGSLMTLCKKTTSHLIFIESGFTPEGKRCFFINDPMRKQEVVLMEEFKNHFSSYDINIYSYDEI